MLIERVRLFGHPGIGDLDLNFCDDDERPAKVVILAGENGVGKTAILEAIFALFYPEVRLDCIIYARIRLSTREQIQLADGIATQAFEVKSTYWFMRGNSQTLSISLDDDGNGSYFGIDNRQGQGSVLRTLYSDANVAYSGTDLTTVQAGELDTRKGSLRAGGLLGTQIPQLLLDIRHADSADLSAWVEANPGLVPPQFITERRVTRFREAFKSIFPTKTFKGIESTGNGRFSVVFEDGARKSSIHNLSTGEKQVVFRAGFIIRDRNIVDEAVILIDEPELSLHPDWQMSILTFYQRIMTNDAGLCPQAIYATHSPFVVHGCEASRVIILKRDADGVVREQTHPRYPGFRAAEAVHAFNLDAFLAKSKSSRLVVLTEGKTDITIIAAAWEALHSQQPLPFVLHPANGCRNIQTTLNDPHVSVLIGDGRVVGLFDFDSAFNDWNGVWSKKHFEFVDVCLDENAGLMKRLQGGRAWALLLPVPLFRADIAGKYLGGKSMLSIEMMFRDEAFPAGMLSDEKVPGGGTVKVFIGDKEKFAENVRSLAQTDFEAFRPLFDRIEQCLLWRPDGEIARP